MTCCALFWFRFFLFPSSSLSFGIHDHGLTCRKKKKKKSVNKKGSCLRGLLQHPVDDLLPGAGAGAEAMGRARVRVVALSVVTLSHVTTLLFYSLALCVRQHRAGICVILSKQRAAEAGGVVHGSRRSC